MNNEHASEEPRNPHVHHEPGDVNAVFLTKFGIGMAFLIVVFLFALWGMFEFLLRREAEYAKPFSRSAIVNTQRQPPEPRLQQHPSYDMDRMRNDEDRLMRQYAWVDPDHGIVRIPIDRAMDLIAQRGLPSWPRGTTK